MNVTLGWGGGDAGMEGHVLEWTEESTSMSEPS